tara:strand:- start:249982 stop:251442 length:1461 start_codon:yes stop_codon:yes gene_type:complete
MKYFLSTLFLLFCFSSAAQVQQLPEDFDETVLRNMEKWHAPGLGLAIVKDGQTILTKGYGVKSFDTMDPVNENTLFQAGSTTKAFAAMSIAMLIDQGKAAWDDPIIKHIPEFKMKDPYVQNNLTIRDAFSHNSGVGQLSNINMFIGQDIDETWALMADVDQSATFRQRWEYNNTTFALSGRVVERLSGLKFHEFVKKNILDPLGMDDTHLLDEDVRSDPNRAQAHQHYNGADYQISYPYIEYTQSAGMINSTPVDMAKWMKFLLAKGEWSGERLVAAEHIEEMMSPQMLLEPADIYPAATTYDHDYYSYGLAWFVHDFRGRKMAMHTGSIDGMIAIIGLIPEENIGVYVFINSDHIEYRHALMYQVIDTLLGRDDTDWSEKIYPVYHPETETEDEKESFPSVEPQELVGTYKLAGSYPLNIEMEGSVLTARTGVVVFDLSRNEAGRYQFKIPETKNVPWERFLDIELNDNGGVSKVTLGGLPYKKQ